MNDKNNKKMITELTDGQINDLLIYTPPYNEQNAANIKSLALNKIKSRKKQKLNLRRILIVAAVMLFLIVGVGAYYIDELIVIITKINGVIFESMDYKFIPDEEVVGKWEVVDFVENIDDFKASETQWEDENFYWLEAIFFNDGTLLSTLDAGIIVTNQWTKGYVVFDNVIPAYTIKNIGGENYIFIQWKSGDYTILGMKPYYYVFKKTSPDLPDPQEYLSENLKRLLEERRNDDSNITVNEVNGVIYDIIDYKFIPDEYVLGKWEVVDFVRKIDDFRPDKKQWKEANLFWLDIMFYDDGTAVSNFDTGVSGKTFKLTGIIRTDEYKWTKGYIVQWNTVIPAYTIKNIGGNDYMFIQWKSGDYTVRGMKPYYYVFIRTE